MPWTFYDSSGRRLSITVIADGSITVAKMAALEAAGE